MTSPTRPGSDPTDMIRRLRARPASSWAHGDRLASMRAALRRLADLAADASGSLRRSVPDVGTRALPDQLCVLLADAWAAGVPGDTVDALLANLFSELGVR